MENQHLINLYVKRPIIPADNGENLLQYWQRVYLEEYNLETLDVSFEKNLRNLLVCLDHFSHTNKENFNKILPKNEADCAEMIHFHFDAMISKAEIVLVHCLVINELRNKILNIKENPHFTKIINLIKANPVLVHVYNKINEAV